MKRIMTNMIIIVVNIIPLLQPPHLHHHHNNHNVQNLHHLFFQQCEEGGTNFDKMQQFLKMEPFSHAQMKKHKV